MPFSLIWIGALLMIAGVVYMAGQALWRGRLSRPRQSLPGGVTLEPERREAAAGLGFKANWPGLALLALGAVLLLAGAA
jgi:hypothetical protein